MSEEAFNGKDKIPDADKDFGLPKIEITPIRDDAKSIPLPKTEQKEGILEDDPNRDQPAVTGSVKAEGKDLPSEKEGKGTGLTWLILVLLLLVLAAGGWFYLDNNQQPKIPEKPAATEVPEKVTPSVPEPVDEEASPTPEEQVETYTLTEVTARAASPRYFLVVASFIDEDMARDHSDALLKQGKNTFLVYPYGDIAYYRLAIGQFESFALASKEISRVKDGYEENLWVLKY